MSTQNQIQSQMEMLAEGKRWDYIVLFSSEGLPMASFGETNLYNQDELLEFSFQLINLLPLLKNKNSMNKITIDSGHGKEIIFRFFTIDNHNYTITAIITKQIAYKRNLNQLVQFLQDVLS